MADLAAENADALVRGADLVLDGTDNFETRFLLNDVCVRAGVPWVYGACVGSYGLALLVRPRRLALPALRARDAAARPAPAPPATPPGWSLPSSTWWPASRRREALKLLAGRTETLLAGARHRRPLGGHLRRASTSRGARPGARRAPPGASSYADESRGRGRALCGRDAVQMRPAAEGQIDLRRPRRAAAGRRGRGDATSTSCAFARRDAELVVFGDGRAIVKGVKDAAQARSALRPYVGS